MRRRPSTWSPRCSRATRCPTSRRQSMNRRPRERGAALILLIGIIGHARHPRGDAGHGDRQPAAAPRPRSARERRRSSTRRAPSTPPSPSRRPRRSRRRDAVVADDTGAPRRIRRRLPRRRAPRGDDGRVLRVRQQRHQAASTPSMRTATMMWLEVVLTYHGKTSRMRVLIRQSEQSVISGLPQGRRLQRHGHQARRHE